MNRRVLSFIMTLALCLNLCPVWVLAADESWILDANKTFEGTPYEVAKPYKIDTNGYTLTGTDSTAIRVIGTGELDLKGTVISNKGAGVEVMLDGTLRVTGESTYIKGSLYALDIASGAEVKLSAGKYEGKSSAIQTADGDFAALLAKGCAYFDESENPILPKNVAALKTVTVGQCTGHSGKIYTPNSGTPTHTWTCDYCGTTESEEKCTFDFVQDGDGTAACADCGNRLAIAVDENDLADLVYDGTLQPEEVGVTVILTDPDVNSVALVKDKDFEVNIEKITDAGQATVTVTGITFNGEFVKTYTVEKAEPKIEWSNNTCSVDYDGKEVENLPSVTITAVPGDDLSSKVRYAYKETGDADFTEGLPTNAGTYQVKAYLEESDNYKAMETDPLLVLTINKINPVVAAPSAVKLTYNRTAQELVTAGTLNPVAVGDNLEIQFATEETGTYSTTIPTGTDAGDSYRVWYKVVGLTDNYIALASNPAEITGVEIQRKPITPVVELEYNTCLYDGGVKEPKVTVKDVDHVTVLLNTEYQVEYQDNRNVGTAKVVVTDKTGGNYAITQAEATFEITQKTQDSLTITNRPNTVTYGDKFTLETSGGSGSGDVTWEITNGTGVAKVDASSGQVTVIGHGSATVKATKSGAAPTRAANGNYEDATATWTFTADKKPVTATVTADDKDYDGDNGATVHAVVEQGVLPGDEVTIIGLTGTFSDANAGVDKTVTVVTSGAAIKGKNSEHYAVSYSNTTVKAAIHKAVVNVTTPPVAASLTYNGTAQALIATGAVVDTTGVDVEYALSKDGSYSTDFPKGTNAGVYTVWYRVKETSNYTGLAPVSVDVTIAKKSVSPTITLDQVTFVYDGNPKEPVVTLYEADGTTVIPAGEYTVVYSGNTNVGTATVTVTAKADGNYTFENAPVTATFTINKEQAQVLTAPEAAGLPLTFNTFPQRLVTAGVASGGTMVYSVNNENGTYSTDIPTRADADKYTVYYKVQGDSNHSDSAVGHVDVTIAPKRVDNPTIQLFNADDTPLVNYTYDGNAKKPKAVVKDGSTVIAESEYEIRYDNNIDAGNTAVVNIIGKSGGNYDVTGSKTFVIQKANIVFNPAPKAADITYDGKPHELLVPGTTIGGTVQYALGSATTTFDSAIPQATLAGTYTVYYKVVGDKNHNDLNDLTTQMVDVTIQRKPLTDIIIELTPSSFEYDGNVKLPAVTVKDGKTVLPEEEYTWACNVNNPTVAGTYTITVSDKDGGNYDLTNANPKTATFSIKKIDQAELVIEGKPEHVYYGDTFKLTTSGGSGNGAVTWAAVGGNADIDTNGNVTIKGVGEVTINVVKAADTNYEQTSAQWTFTAAPKPVTASVTVSNKAYDGTTAATVDSADINTDLLTGDTVTIDPATITAAFDTPNAGTGKTVMLDTSKVQVTGDTAKYAISYPETVTADITQATTTIGTAPAAIASLTYNGQPQALVTAGQTNVGFLVYSLNRTDFSREIPTGTNAGTYTVYYKVDGTADYTGVAANATPISVTIASKSITPTVELSESSFLYDGTKKEPKITVKDDKTVIDTDQYSVTWANDDPSATGELLTAAGTYTATIKNVANGNYSFSTTTEVEIKEAPQDALHITGKPDHVYYGDTITLKATGGSGNGTLEWSITPDTTVATIDQNTGVLTVKGVGDVTVTVKRTVPNYVTATDTWSFTAKPKPVTAVITADDKVYNGKTDATIHITWEPVLVGKDEINITSLSGAFADANAGVDKTVNITGGPISSDKYAITIPSTTTASIFKAEVTVPALAANDREYDGTAQALVTGGNTGTTFYSNARCGETRKT